MRVTKFHLCLLLLFILLTLPHSSGASSPHLLLETRFQPHAPIQIVGSTEFTSANGIVSGNGSETSPYLIGGWDITPPSGKCVTSDGTTTCTVPSGSGIGIQNTTAYVVVDRVYIHSGGISSCAICLYNATNVTVENSIISNNYHGFAIENSSNIDLLNNSLANNSILARDSNSLTITNNNAGNSTMAIWSSFSSTLFNNTLEESSLALVSDHSATVSSNTIINVSALDGLVFQGSSGIHFYGNNVIDAQLAPGADVGGFENSWDAGYPAGGNYWSSYDGVDRCGGTAQNVCTGPGGIGDTPYEIDANNFDHYPLMKPRGVNLFRAIPTWPEGAHLVADQQNDTSVYLVWTASAYDPGVIRYRVSANDTTVAVTRAVSGSSPALGYYLVSGLRSGSSYTFKVEAGTPSDNWSLPLQQTLTLKPMQASEAGQPNIVYALIVDGTVAIVAMILVVIALRVNRPRNNDEAMVHSSMSSGPI